MSMNKITIIGHLGRDPEMRYTPSGDAVTNFSVATSRRYRTRDGDQREETEWFNISAWGRLAEVTNQYLAKGRQVYVEGRLSSRLYQSQNGETRVSLDVNAQEVQFLSGGGDPSMAGASGGGGGGYDGGGAPPATDDDVDDLPW